MYARVLRFGGDPESIERGAATYREQVLPYVREVTGFRGHTILLDRETGDALSITFWASEDALREYEPTAERFRELLAETFDTPVRGVTTYELVLFELGG